jgi:N6-adenosine-specific RNA methylase IME4
LKDDEGADAWFHEAHELIFVCARGVITPPAPEKLFPSVIKGPAREHSSELEELFELIDRYFPNLAKEDLDQRVPRGELDR